LIFRPKCSIAFFLGAYLTGSLPEFWKTLVSIRRVCRALRHGADRLSFWQSENFDFSQYRFRNLGYYDKDLDKMRFLVDAMLQDKHLRQQLGKKSDWTNSVNGSSELLWIIVSNLPDFGQKARIINLKMHSRFLEVGLIINTSVSALKSTYPNLECLRLYISEAEIPWRAPAQYRAPEIRGREGLCTLALCGRHWGTERAET
jgi:hypothetical protein